MAYCKLYEGVRAKPSGPDPYGQMGKGRTHYGNRFINSYITHVDPDLDKKNSNNHVKGELSQCISDYRLDLLGITETHFPGAGSELLDMIMVHYAFTLDG